MPKFGSLKLYFPRWKKEELALIRSACKQAIDDLPFVIVGRSRGDDTAVIADYIRRTNIPTTLYQVAPRKDQWLEAWEANMSINDLYDYIARGVQNPFSTGLLMLVGNPDPTWLSLASGVVISTSKIEDMNLHRKAGRLLLYVGGC